MMLVLIQMLFHNNGPVYAWLQNASWAIWDSGDISPLRLQGVRLVICAQTSLLLSSLSLEGQRSPDRHVKLVTYLYLFLALQLSTWCSSALRKQPPRPALTMELPLYVFCPGCIGTHSTLHYKTYVCQADSASGLTERVYIKTHLNNKCKQA